MAEITEVPRVNKADKETVEASEGQTSTKFVNASKIATDAEKIRAKRELPKAPGTVIKFDDLKQWLALLNSEMYERLMIYVYRHKPVINRQFVDPNADNNIDVISGEGCRGLSEEYFIDRHGGGSYGLTIKDTDIQDRTKGNRGYFEARLSINETQYPPKLDYREVDWPNEKNKGYFAWARAQRIVDNNGVIMDPTKKGESSTAQSNGGSQHPDNAVAVMKATMDMVGKLNEQQQRDFKRSIGGDDAVNKPMTELLIAKMKEDSPNNIMPLLSTLLPLLIKQQQPVVPAGDGGLAAMATMMTTLVTAMMNSGKETMAMMQQSNQNTMTLLTTILNNSKGGDDEGDRLKQVVEIAKMIKGNAPPETSVAERLMDKGIELLLPVTNIIANITGIKAGQVNGGIGNNPAGHPIAIGQGTPTGGDNFNGNNLARGNQNPRTPPLSPSVHQSLTEDFSSTGTPTPGVSAENSAQIPNDAALVMPIQQYGALIINSLNKGEEGWEFAEQVAKLFGDMIIKSVANLGVDNIIRGMKLVPEFWNAVGPTYGEAHMRKWCEEFINYKRIIAEMDRMDIEDMGAVEEIEEVETEKTGGELI